MFLYAFRLKLGGFGGRPKKNILELFCRGPNSEQLPLVSFIFGQRLQVFLIRNFAASSLVSSVALYFFLAGFYTPVNATISTRIYPFYDFEISVSGFESAGNGTIREARCILLSFVYQPFPHALSHFEIGLCWAASNSWCGSLFGVSIDVYNGGLVLTGSRYSQVLGGGNSDIEPRHFQMQAIERISDGVQYAGSFEE